MAGKKTLKTTTIVGSVLCIAMLLASCMKQTTVPPGADDYFDKAPFAFEGSLKRLYFKNLKAE
jgi:PBP1b-binding outer membrane lipoprotein LpoB